MKEFWNWTQAAIAAAGGGLGYFLGGWDGFLYALLAFVVIDYITGLMCAVLDKKLSNGSNEYMVERQKVFVGATFKY